MTVSSSDARIPVSPVQVSASKNHSKKPMSRGTAVCDGRAMVASAPIMGTAALRRRCHGASHSPMTRMTASSTNARMIESDAPTVIGVQKARRSPLKISRPSPPCPMIAATVTSPTVDTVAMRIPVTM